MLIIDQQNKNAMEIVKRGELLYEKFVGFTKNFENIGKHPTNCLNLDNGPAFRHVILFTARMWI